MDLRDIGSELLDHLNCRSVSSVIKNRAREEQNLLEEIVPSKDRVVGAEEAHFMPPTSQRLGFFRYILRLTTESLIVIMTNQNSHSSLPVVSLAATRILAQKRCLTGQSCRTSLLPFCRGPTCSFASQFSDYGQGRQYPKCPSTARRCSRRHHYVRNCPDLPPQAFKSLVLLSHLRSHFPAFETARATQR